VPVGIDRGFLISVRDLTPIFTPYGKFALLLHFESDPEKCFPIAESVFGPDIARKFIDEILTERGPTAFLAVLRGFPESQRDNILFEILESSGIEVR
jgi:hypothetical protein